MARTGESERVRSIFERIPEHERAPYASPRVLSEVVFGSLARLRALPPQAPAVIDRERRFIDEALGLLVAACRQERAYPRELFRCLLDCSCEQLGAARLEPALECCSQALELGVLAFPDLHARVVLQRAAILSAKGQIPEAHAALSALYARLDLVPDRKLVPALILALGRTSLLTGQAAFFRRLMFAGLRAFYTGVEERRTMLRLLRRAYRGSPGLLRSREPTAGDKLVFLAHWLCLILPGALRSRALARACERLLLAGLYLVRYWHGARGTAGATPGPAPRRRLAGTVVTRAMGGLGDLLMMTPGLHALGLSGARLPIQLALPRPFFPLFEGNTDVTLLDIRAELDPLAYELWLNLTDCPAARSESLSAPRVRRNRIEIFARALGVRGRALRRLDRRPRYFLSAEDLDERERFFGEHGLRGRSVIGVQLRSDESYRDYPYMPALVQALTERHAVLLFDSRPIVGYDFAGVVEVRAEGFRQAAAVASGCRALVAPDSAFVHLAGALALPCIGLFGPTDGALRTGDYPTCRFLDARRNLRCIPCWRNEETACALTGGRVSVCLGEIAPAAVVAALEALLAETAATPAHAEGA
jgi:hypothetical protein